jgi:hypothetical protein
VHTDEDDDNDVFAIALCKWLSSLALPFIFALLVVLEIADRLSVTLVGQQGESAAGLFGFVVINESYG